MKPRLSAATLRRALLCGGLSLLFAAIPSFGWWYVMERDTAEAQVFELEIPAGTAVQVANGAAPPSIPDSLRFRPGSSLRISNLDVVTHTIGQQAVAPGQVRLLPLRALAAAGQGRFLCSFHPGGVIGLQVDGGSSPVSAIWSMLIFAAPLAFVSFGVVSVLDRIGD